MDKDKALRKTVSVLRGISRYAYAIGNILTFIIFMYWTCHMWSKLSIFSIVFGVMLVLPIFGGILKIAAFVASEVCEHLASTIDAIMWANKNARDSKEYYRAYEEWVKSWRAESEQKSENQSYYRQYQSQDQDSNTYNSKENQYSDTYGWKREQNGRQDGSRSSSQNYENGYRKDERERKSYSGGNVSQKDAAMRLFGLKEPFTKAELKAKYRVLMKKSHPDSGGSDEQAAMVNKAYELLKEYAKG